MSVNQVHQGLGGWTLNLRAGGAADDFIARVSPWDHIAVVPKGLGPQPSLESIKNTAVFTGRLDAVDVDGGSVQLSGPSTAVWLGDESGRGRFPNNAVTETTQTVDVWLQVLIWGVGGLRPGTNLNGLFPGTVQNMQASPSITWEIPRFYTVRQQMDELASLCDRPFEWRVRPNGAVDVEGWSSVADFTRTIFAYLPRVLLADGLPRTDGMSQWGITQLPLQVFPADISVSWDFSQFAARGIARGNDNGTPLASTGTEKDGTATRPGVNGYSFDPAVRVGWDTIVDFDTKESGPLQQAANSVGRLASIRREWTVSAGSSEIVGYLQPGDYLWIHADDIPGIGSLTYAQEQEEWASLGSGTDPATKRFGQAANVNVGGRNIYPVQGRVDSMSWACSDRWDYWLLRTADGSGDVEQITSLVDFDPEGPATIDVNGNKPRWQMQRQMFGRTLARSVSLDANSPTNRSR